MAETTMSPFALADRQIAMDREAMAATAWLADKKRARLSPSPFAFLRGSAPLFYEILAARPELAEGPPGDGWIVGDMHLENVGAYRDDDDEVVFGLNDFDDATLGPLRYDVLRFSTSVLCAARAFHATGAEAIALVERAVAAYLAARRGAHAPETPKEIEDLVTRAKSRTKKELLDERAPLEHGRRSFVAAGRYHPLPHDVAVRVPALVAAYIEALGARAPGHAGDWKVEDSAFRIAGNGSLGVLRIAVLLRGHDGDERLVELKECHEPSPSTLFAPPQGAWSHAGERVASAARALTVAPPRLLAPVALDGRAYVGRRLFPQEDKLAVEDLRVGPALDALVGFIGHVLGASHARGVSSRKGAPLPTWTVAEVDAVIEHAIVLAGLLEGTYLAWCRRAA